MYYILNNKIKFFLGLFFGFNLFAPAQETVEAKTNTDDYRKWHFGIGPVGVKDFGKQANYFRGYNSFGIAELLSLTTVRNELYTKTGMNYSLNEYPGLMRYNFGIGSAVTALYHTDGINFIMSGGIAKLSTSGVFTLAATNPSNPSGDDLIKLETINGIERRTWMKAGVQFVNSLSASEEFFFEIAPSFYFQKAMKNYVVIEGSTYQLLINNPANIGVKTSYTGYGISSGLGVQKKFAGDKLVQLSANCHISRLNMLKVKGLNIMLDINLSIFL